MLEELVELYLYSRDASLMHGEATCVVFPTPQAEVAEVVLVAEKHGVPIVARAREPVSQQALYPSTGESSCPPRDE